MQRRGRYFALGVLSILGLSGCPVTDDYFLLSADEPRGLGGVSGKGGSLSEAGSDVTAGTNASGSPSAGGNGAQAGSAGVGGTSSAGGEPVVSGGAPEVGGAPDTGQAGQPAVGQAGAGGELSEPCVPTTERCNGHDDDCNDVIDEFVCQTGCSGFVLAADPNHGYMYCTASRKANWDDAKAACADQDMRLAWLDSAEENAAVAQKLDALGSDVEVMFGATDQGSEGAWLWAGGEQFWTGDEDGSPIGGMYNRWAPGTPNNTSNEDCILINTTTAYWGDRSCTSIYPYVCEQPD
jgi:hypothetical protein